MAAGAEVAPRAHAPAFLEALNRVPRGNLRRQALVDYRIGARLMPACVSARTCNGPFANFDVHDHGRILDVDAQRHERFGRCIWTMAGIFGSISLVRLAPAGLLCSCSLFLLVDRSGIRLEVVFPSFTLFITAFSSSSLSRRRVLLEFLINIHPFIYSDPEFFLFNTFIFNSRQSRIINYFFLFLINHVFQYSTKRQCRQLWLQDLGNNHTADDKSLRERTTPGISHTANRTEPRRSRA